MKKSDKTPWMDAAEYGRSLKGFGVNLLYADVERAVAFQSGLLGCEVVYADVDFAVMRHEGVEWMLHADHTYRDNVLAGTAEADARGQGVEFRIHNVDPDAIEANARDAGYSVLAGAMDKPHGTREAVIMDDEGYVWAVDAPLGV